MRLIAVVAVRNESEQLPGLFANVAPHVNGVVALDDGSTDGTGEWLAARPEVVELVRVPQDRPEWNDPGNYRALVAAAVRQGADWILSLDADERVERDFRQRAERAIRRGSRLGSRALAVRVRELWDTRDHYRCDGAWGDRWMTRLYRPLPGDRFSDLYIHGSRAALDVGRTLFVDLTLYHLGMLTAEERRARRERYERIDPDGRWQAQGYAHLTDETGIRLRPVPARRGFAD